jgi:hypothetical protein
MLVRRASRLRPAILSLIGIVAIACQASDPPTYTVQRLALDTLFNGREHARELVIWSSDSAGPALENILSQHHLDHARVDVERLEPTLPTITVDEQTLTDLFREHPDAWAEFFRLHPRSPGLVELSAVRFSSGDSVAETFVGRTCGAHCQNAWRVVAKRDASGAWKVTDLQWIRVPQT